MWPLWIRFIISGRWEVARRGNQHSVTTSVFLEQRANLNRDLITNVEVKVQLWFQVGPLFQSNSVNNFKKALHSVASSGCFFGFSLWRVTLARRHLVCSSRADCRMVQSQEHALVTLWRRQLRFRQTFFLRAYIHFGYEQPKLTNFYYCPVNIQIL